ncbi:HD-GYP domain-containing protein [Clostridium beijerinckii]|uniref:HD-GYP domain-containing protein n=1 Tax=Clostridium beijerinckii TaxID=1520 RepID=UPI00047DE6A9|nr:HD-GYP domain-containing protein [Clostridium beijerinckii]
MKQKILVFDCKPGMILAEDIIYNGLKLASRNTMLNAYIIDKLISLGEYSAHIYVSEGNNNLGKSNIDKIKEFEADYDVSIYNIKEVINELITTDNMNAESISKISKSIIKYLDEPNITIKCLVALKEADEYTYKHCINVAIYSMLIAKWMNLSSDTVKEIIESGLLHDIGKIKIDNEILNKPSKLTREEFDEIKKHTILGYDIINDYNYFSRNIKDAILMHHERIDGSGYPFGKLGRDITLNAKIVAAADTFDAMTSNRVYKKGLTPFKTFEMFLTEGVKLYDTSVIFALLENISPYYIGMKVRLQDGKIGEIMYIPPNDILNPIIKVNNELIDFSRRTDLDIENIFV